MHKHINRIKHKIHKMSIVKNNTHTPNLNYQCKNC